jgi:hypothetical protein
MDRETREEPAGPTSKVTGPSNSGAPSVSIPPAPANDSVPAELPVGNAKPEIETEVERAVEAKTETKTPPAAILFN